MSKARTRRSNTVGPRIKIDRLPALAADLVRRTVAVIATAGGPQPALAAKAATSTIPIVFGVPEDPVRLGLVASIARPGGNVTGINFVNAELTAKRLELLRELVPGATRVAVLVNPANPTSTETTLREVQSAAGAMGLQIQVLNASTSREINAAFAKSWARAGGRPLRQPGRILQQSAAATGEYGGAPRDPHDIRFPRHCRSRRADELRH